MTRPEGSILFTEASLGACHAEGDRHHMEENAQALDGDYQSLL